MSAVDGSSSIPPMRGQSAWGHGRPALADSAVKSTGGVESAGSSSHNISNVFAMVRISWVNVWTHSRSWSGFIVYLSSLRFWGLSGLFLPTSNQEFLGITKDIVRHRRPASLLQASKTSKRD